MTLIVGILCEDGVAIASDKQSTAGTLVLTAPKAIPQFQQLSTGRVTKVTKIGADVLIGVAGTPVIGEEYRKAIDTVQGTFSRNDYDHAVKSLKIDIVNIIKPRLDVSASAARTIGPSAAYSEAVCECVMAAKFKDGHALLQIQQQGAFDRANKEIPFKVIGSGQTAADPFLNYLRNTFWPDRLPTVEEGVLAAYWAVHYSIEVGAPGIGPPIAAYKLAKVNNRFVGADVTADELKQHDDFIRAAREAMRSMVAKVGDASPADASQVPTMQTPLASQ